MTDAPTPLTPEALAELESLDKVATPGSWKYCPQEFDDWGEIRGSTVEEGFTYRVARGYAGGPVNEDDHRRANTDPYAANSRLIVALRNAFPSLAATIRNLMTDMETIDRILERGCYIVSKMHENDPNETVADNGMTVWDAVLVELAQWADSATAARLKLRNLLE